MPVGEEEGEEEREGNGTGCSPEKEHKQHLSLEAFITLSQAGILEEVSGGGFQPNIHQFSRCALSGLWSPLIGSCQRRGSWVTAAGPGVTHLVLLFFWTWSYMFVDPECLHFLEKHTLTYPNNP